MASTYALHGIGARQRHRQQKRQKKPQRPLQHHKTFFDISVENTDTDTDTDTGTETDGAGTEKASGHAIAPITVVSNINTGTETLVATSDVARNKRIQNRIKQLQAQEQEEEMEALRMYSALKSKQTSQPQMQLQHRRRDGGNNTDFDSSSFAQSRMNSSNGGGRIHDRDRDRNPHYHEHERRRPCNDRYASFCLPSCFPSIGITTTPCLDSFGVGLGYGYLGYGYPPYSCGGQGSNGGCLIGLSPPPPISLAVPVCAPPPYCPNVYM